MKEEQVIKMVRNIGKQINLPLLDNCKGRIIGIYVDEGEPEYNTCYFHSGDRKTCYFNMNDVKILE